MLRNLFLSILIISCSLTFAQSSVTTDLSDKYQVVNQALSQPSSKLTLYCWPGSKSCYLLETALRQWAVSNNFTLEHLSLVKRPHWRRLAKARYVAQQMNIDEVFGPALYQLLHQSAQPIISDEDLFNFVASLGLDHIRFTNVFYAAETNQALNDIQHKAQTLSIEGIPTLVVGDKWLLDARKNQTSRSFIDTINQLIATP